MAMVNMNIRIDDELKYQFNTICKGIGMSMSTAFNVFAKAVVREKKMPIEMKYEDPFYSKENMEYLAKSIEKRKQGKVVEKTMEEMEEYWGDV